MENLIAVLYSFEQKVFHIEPLSTYILSNIQSSYLKKYNQFRLIGITENNETANGIIEVFKSKFNW